MRIHPEVLENIRTTEREVPINCLKAMLENAFVLIDPPLTWRALAEAVEPINPAKAKEIRDTYCGVGKLLDIMAIVVGVRMSIMHGYSVSVVALACCTRYKMTS